MIEIPVQRLTSIDHQPWLRAEFFPVPPGELEVTVDLVSESGVSSFPEADLHAVESSLDVAGVETHLFAQVGA